VGLRSERPDPTASHPEPIESALVAAAARGDADAFGNLYQQHYRRIFRTCSRVGRAEDAEDLVQQVFLQAWRAVARYRPTSSPFAAWLFTIANNAVASHYRRSRRSRRDCSLEADVRELPSEEDIEGAEILLESERVLGMLRRLRPAYQQVVKMRFVENLTYPEVAMALGTTQGNVRMIQHRAVIELRRLLAG
jgi:RNA polymerase sigma-70 factor (ECF subfamily)